MRRTAFGVCFTTSGSRHGQRSNLGVSVKLLLLLLVALVASACAGGRMATPSPSPAATPIASPTRPSIEPSAVAQTPRGSSSPIEPAPEGLAIDSIALVVTDDLRVRSRPGVTTDSKMLTPLLDRGREVFVLDGPVPASGYDWYLVQPLPAAFGESDAPLGWVAAAGRDGEEWLAAASITCPSRPDLAVLASMNPHHALACYGGRKLTLTARLGGFDGLSCPDLPPFIWSVEPSWLSPCAVYDALAPRGDRPVEDYFLVSLDPAIDREALPEYGAEAEIWTAVEVTGRYDHSAARSCQATAGPDELQPPTAAAVVLDCRSRFVVTSVRVLD